MAFATISAVIAVSKRTSSMRTRARSRKPGTRTNGLVVHGPAWSLPGRGGSLQWFLGYDAVAHSWRLTTTTSRICCTVAAFSFRSEPSSPRNRCSSPSSVPSASDRSRWCARAASSGTTWSLRSFTVCPMPSNRRASSPSDTEPTPRRSGREFHHCPDERHKQPASNHRPSHVAHRSSVQHCVLLAPTRQAYGDDVG